MGLCLVSMMAYSKEQKRQSFADRSGPFLQGVRHCPIKGTENKVPFRCFFKELNIWVAYQLPKKLFPLLFKWMATCQTQLADTLWLLNQGSMPGPKLFNMYVSDLQPIPATGIQLPILSMQNIQSNLDYPDLDYPDFFTGPSLVMNIY